MKLILIIVLGLLVGFNIPAYAGDKKTVCENARDKARDKCFQEIDRKGNRHLFPRCILPYIEMCESKKSMKYTYVGN